MAIEGPKLHRSINYLKFVNQHFMEHVGVLVGETTKIMEIKTTKKLLSTVLVDGASTYTTIITRTWDKQMKVTISLEKYLRSK